VAKASKKKSVASPSESAVPSRLSHGVIFEFYNMETAREYAGSVSDGGNTMTIEIPAQPGTQHCLVKGLRKGHLFHGRNSYSEMDPVDVEATWCDVGDGFLCLWIEEGTEYVVRFTLPR
jgi:hypothetical protein